MPSQDLPAVAPMPPRRRPPSRAGAPQSSASVVISAAPIGVHSSSTAGPGDTTVRPATEVDDARAHTHHLRDRLGRSRVVEEHLLGRQTLARCSPPRPAARTRRAQASEHPRAGPPRRAAASMSRQPRCSAMSWTSTRQRVAASSPAAPVPRAATPTATFSIASASTPTGTPASTRAPRSRSPLAPAAASTQATRSAIVDTGDRRGARGSRPQTSRSPAASLRGHSGTLPESEPSW